MQDYLDGLWWPRLLLQRGLAAIYLIAFASALLQFRPLLGEHGLTPAPRFLAQVSFRRAPSLFHIRYSDRLFAVVAWLGVALSLAALSGFADGGPNALSLCVWLGLWALYLSIVNVGQTFYGFGWESLLLEAGFFAAFLGVRGAAPSPVPIFIFRWLLFRVELGAGLIKLRHDECWRDLTCLFFHYETQPLPNPLSWYFHRLPQRIHKLSVVFSHFVQLVAPFGLLLPQPAAALAGALIVVHQLLLVVSGNYAWLNWLTIVLGFSAFDDQTLAWLLPLRTPETVARTELHDALLDVLAGITLVLSVKPTRNFFSKRQIMNYAYNPLHLVNAYGAFGSVTRRRYEIVIEGSAHAPDRPGQDGAGAAWREYEFRGKPGDPRRRPPQVAPYHLRLDWLMWFLPFRTMIVDGGVLPLSHERWFLQLVRRLLEGDRATLALLRHNPFPDAPPRRIRARVYHYEFTDRRERKESGAWWKRRLVGEYLPPVSSDELPT